MGEKKAFVVISFAPEFKNIYDSAIKLAIESNHLIAQKADGKDKALRVINDDIVEKIEEAEIIIIDISNVEDDNQNNIDLSNIYFELGLAMARIKRCIIITQDPDNLPFDLKSYGVLGYDKNDHEKLKNDLTEEIEKALNEDAIDIFKNIQKNNTDGRVINKKSSNQSVLLKNELLDDLLSHPR